MKMQILEIGLGALLIPVLTGCSERPLVKLETLPLNPPQALLQDCPQTPIPEIRTNGELFAHLIQVSLDLQACAQSKQRLREWYERTSPPAQKGKGN